MERYAGILVSAPQLHEWIFACNFLLLFSFVYALHNRKRDLVKKWTVLLTIFLYKKRG